MATHLDPEDLRIHRLERVVADLGNAHIDLSYRALAGDALREELERTERLVTDAAVAISELGKPSA
ncbi:hypothetical protein ACH4GK_31830 [Streptomyces rimosus]|uniref:hypothetical protein n=1 Tax=Streptomyces rimosus TaxID=1927 RepID=UPI0004C6FA5E|nr:hypothetical protein [Streptomyces rimosus]